MRTTRLALIASTVVAVVQAPLSVDSSAAAPSAANLARAVQVVSNWSLAQIANETVVVSVNAMNVASMIPAASFALAQKDSNAIQGAVANTRWLVPR
jgi:hypothetical protein